MRPSGLVRLLALVLASLLVPCSAGAQTRGSVPRVGVVHLGGEFGVWVDGLRQGLRERGLEEGKHFALEIRDTKGDPKAVEGVARELERERVALICALATSVTLAVKRATSETPIVFFAGSDPVAAGLVASFAKPGGRLTGVHNQLADLTGKRLEILKETVPVLRRVVIVYNPGNPVAKAAAQQAREAAQRLHVDVLERQVGSVEALRSALQRLEPRPADAYFYTPDAMVSSQAQLVIDTARTKRLPTMFHEAGLVAKGGLASYGYSYRETGRMAAKYVQRILAGTPPRDLPVENYDRIELALNLRTAPEIGLNIPSTVRLRADTVIE